MVGEDLKQSVSSVHRKEFNKHPCGAPQLVVSADDLGYIHVQRKLREKKKNKLQLL